MMTKDEVRSLLPRVGDKLIERPTLTDKKYSAELQECTVVEVNTAHLWYRVRFKDGTCECYKLPKLKPRSQGGILDD